MSTWDKLGQASVFTKDINKAFAIAYKIVTVIPNRGVLVGPSLLISFGSFKTIALHWPQQVQGSHQIKGVGRFMKNTNSLTIEELERRIAHFEDRLKDFIITEEQIEFIKERLRELKNAKESVIDYIDENGKTSQYFV
ncbi:hypothetical protein [Neobacillus drentensis]|uniref:hypothetical protein n=1 Tax=Neobacillus drentensis TaxID=220684 RepID=UPI002FFF2832